jgi:hypothetical protein
MANFSWHPIQAGLCAEFALQDAAEISGANHCISTFALRKSLRNGQNKKRQQERHLPATFHFIQPGQAAFARSPDFMSYTLELKRGKGIQAYFLLFFLR